MSYYGRNSGQGQGGYDEQSGQGGQGGQDDGHPRRGDGQRSQGPSYGRSDGYEQGGGYGQGDAYGRGDGYRRGDIYGPPAGGYGHPGGGHGRQGGGYGRQEGGYGRQGGGYGRQSGGFDRQGGTQPHHDDRGRYQGRGGGREGNFNRGDGDRGRGGDRGGRRFDRQESVVPYNKKLAPKEMKVCTNYYRIRVQQNNRDMNLFEYHIKIVPLRKEFTKNEAGDLILDSNGKKQFVLLPKEDVDLFIDRHGEDNGDSATDLTRLILIQCQQDLADEGILIYTDGTSLAFSLNELHLSADLSERPPKQRKIDYYGHSASESKSSEPENIFFKDIILRTNEDNILTKTKNFRVIFSNAKPISFSFNQMENKLMADGADKLRVLNFLNIGIKNSMMKAMKSFGQSAEYFYPNPVDQRALISDIVRKRFVNEWVEPITGVRETAHLLGNDNLFIMANFAMHWVTKKAPVLSVKGRSILGIPIRSLNERISGDVFDNIHKLMKKTKFHVEYNRGSQWVEAMRQKNWSEEKIKENVIFTKRGIASMYRSKDESVFLASAEDHKFTATINEKEVECNVAQYYNLKGIPLRFPNMPIVRISKFEWFPIEFLFQAVDAKRMPNDRDVIDVALHFNDEFSGHDRVKRITTLLHEATVPDLIKGRQKKKEFFDKISLCVENNPLRLNAYVLNSPNLEFDHMKNAIRGSWNTHGAKFETPAAIPSFAIVNCDSQPNRSSSIMIQLFEICKNHGMKVPFVTEDFLRSVTVPNEVRPSATGGPDISRMKRSIQNAINQAKQAFLYSNGPSLYPSFGLHQTYLNENGKVYPCLVDTGRSRSREEIVIYLRNDAGLITLPRELASLGAWQPTHHVMFEGKKRFARLMLGIDDNDAGEYDEKLIDMFDLSEGQTARFTYSAFISLEGAPPERVGFNNFAFVFRVCMGPGNFVDEHTDFFQNPVPIVTSGGQNILSGNAVIECPSIVFFLIPKKDTKTYNVLKEICRVDYGVQSQVIALDTWSNQRNRDMYYSGIALKLNSKLAHFGSKIRAWKIDGHPWIKELKTAVIGYSMATGQGQNNTMIVAATVALDAEGLAISEDFAIQEKQPLANRDVLRKLTKGLIADFKEYQQGFPRRVLVYRHGGQDGLFERMLTEELKAISQGIQDAQNEGDNDRLDPIPVTFIIAQSQHGVYIVPAEPTARRNENVPSGTCVDLALNGMAALNLNHDRADSSIAINTPPARRLENIFDFHLVPQHGLKGTSKPVYFRCIWNENYATLSKEVLENLTYCLSFQYGTATKTTRLISVLAYAERMANAALAYESSILQILDEQGQPWVSGNPVKLLSYKSIFKETKHRQTSFHVHNTA